LFKKLGKSRTLLYSDVEGTYCKTKIVDLFQVFCYVAQRMCTEGADKTWDQVIKDSRTGGTVVYGLSKESDFRIGLNIGAGQSSN
jgi:hypothetical protein